MRPTTTTNPTNRLKELRELADLAINWSSYILTIEEAQSIFMSSALLWFGKANSDRARFEALNDYSFLEEAVISSLKSIEYSVGRLSDHYKTALSYTARASELVAEISELYEEAQ